MERVPLDEIAMHPHSALDEAGQPFKWRGEIYRGIAPAWATFFRKLCDDGTIGELAARGLLVQSEIAPLTVEGFDLVLRHRKVPFASYPEEWSPAMFRDAVLTVVDLWTALVDRGLSLKDSHPWNVLFDGCQPVWVDLTSIVPLDQTWERQPCEELLETCLAPLLLMAEGNYRVARSLMQLGLSGAEYARFLPDFQRTSWQKLRDRVSRRLPKPPVRERLQRFLRETREQVAGVRLPAGSGSAESPKWSEAVSEVTRRMNPGSVLDVSEVDVLVLAGSSEVVRFDSDPMAVDRLYLQHRSSGHRVLPLVMDFANPTPASGLADHRYLSAVKRFRCDGVVALGLVRRVIFDYGRIGLSEIAGGLADLAKEWALVDFTLGPAEGRRGEYSAEALTKALEKRFEIVKIQGSEINGSQLLLCEQPKLGR